MNVIKCLPGTCKALGVMLSSTHGRRRSRKKSKRRNSKGQRKRRGEKEGRGGDARGRGGEEGEASDPDSAAGPSPSHPR